MYRGCAVCTALVIAVTGFGQAIPTTIYELQSDRDTVTQNSNWLDSLVTVSGIVTADYGVINARTFCMEMSQGGPWSGIMVYKPTALGVFPVELGDSLRITGTVSEYYTGTEISVGDTNDIVRLGTTNLPPFSIISTAHLDTTATSSFPVDSAEAYEGVLIQVQNAFVTDDVLDEHDRWEISDGNGYVKVRTNAPYSYTPEEGDFLNVSGIAQTDYGLYCISPRMNEDIEVLGEGRLSVVYPTSRMGINVQFTRDVDTVTASDLSNYEILPSLNITDAELDAKDHSLVHLTTGTQSDALLCTLVVHDVQDIGANLIYDTTTFYGGFVPIQTIQSDTVPSDPNFASLWDGRTVTITGIITAETDCFPFDWYWVQQDEGSWSGLMAMHTGHPYPSVRGDSVIIACQINEYEGMTEMGTILYYNIESSGNTLPSPSVIHSGDLNAATGVTAEQWEGVLIKVDSATVVNAGSEPGNSDWYINDGTGQCTVGNYDAYSYVPDSGDVVSVTGVIRFFSGFNLYPRDNEDIELIQHGIEESTLRDFDMTLLSNPASLSSRVLFTIPEKSFVDLSVYNLVGQRVASIKKGIVEPGSYNFTWDTKKIPNGVYFYRLKTEDRTLVRKVIILK